MISATVSRPLQRETPFEQVAARLPDWMRPHLPHKWVQLGRVLLLRLPLKLEAEAQAVAAAYATLPGVEATASLAAVEAPRRKLTENDVFRKFFEENIKILEIRNS